MPAATPRGASDAVRETRELLVVDLGRRGYRETLALQRGLAARRRAGDTPDVLLFVEHPPVITLGRSSDRAHVLPADSWLEEHGIEVVEIERGGDVTYHGPGQLVGYPILDLRGHRQDLHWYLRRLEQAIFEAMGELGLAGFRVEGYTGAWTGDPEDRGTVTVDPDGFSTVARPTASAMVLSGRVRKLASIGVHASRWVTRHGFALNVTTEPLDAFDWIVPCGIDGVTMTSLESEGHALSWPGACDLVLRGFNAAFPEARPRLASGDDLGL